MQFICSLFRLAPDGGKVDKRATDHMLIISVDEGRQGKRMPIGNKYKVKPYQTWLITFSFVE